MARVSTALDPKSFRNQMLLIVVASLGYFVDIYDLVLFNAIKKASLSSLGLLDAAQQNEIFLFNMQMTGMLLGGIIWGILGDKKGRLSVLFGSILCYSLANIANAFTPDLTSYAIVRLVAGFGLAGELGAGITLVVETMSKEKRGYGTMIIVTFGALGAVVAGLLGKNEASLGHFFNNIFGSSMQGWQFAYIIGGIMGLGLLALRIGTVESGMFSHLKEHNKKRGDLRVLFSSGKTFMKYLYCILVGLPIWFIIGVLINLSTGFSGKIGIEGTVETSQAVMFAYIGLSVGDFISGLLSQLLKSRRKVVIGYLFASMLLVGFFMFPFSSSLTVFYFMCFLLGCATGYWALFVTIAAEQFGTNIRSTVANTVPNFVRGAVVPITLSYKALIPGMGHVGSALLVGGVCMALALFATIMLRETFSKEMDYVEE